VYRPRVYSVRRRDQPACWMRRTVNKFVNDVRIQPNRSVIHGNASKESICMPTGPNPGLDRAPCSRT
jgi:hypothetical protein